MPKLLSAVIGSGFALALSAAIAQDKVPAAQKAQGEYKVASQNCTNMGGAGREECLKGAKVTVRDPECGKLTDREKRECVLDAFVRKHDLVPGAGQPAKGQPAAPIVPQPR